MDITAFNKKIRNKIRLLGFCFIFGGFDQKVELPLRTRVNPLDIMVESGHLEPERPGAYDIRSFLLRGERMTSDVEDDK